jgi:hypothetical protein
METTALLRLAVEAFFFFGFAADFFERDDLDFVAIPNVLQSVLAKSIRSTRAFGTEFGIADIPGAAAGD